MRYVIAVGLLVLASCGTNVSGRATLAQARATCFAIDPTLTDELWTEGIQVLVTARDNGETREQALGQLEGCSIPGCSTCGRQLVDAIWP